MPDYEKYSVSNLGNVIFTETGKPVKSSVNTRVNVVVNLAKDKTPKTFSIKSLIEKVHGIKIERKIEATEETTEPEIKKVKTKVHTFLKPRKPKTYNTICVV